MEKNLHHSRLLLLSVSLFVFPAWAADPPDAGAVLNLDRSRIEQFLQERKLQEGPVKADIDIQQDVSEKRASEEKNIPLKSFAVDASSILGVDEIKAVLTPYEGRTVSLVDLLDAVEAINRLYAEKNMPTARAFLPPQDVKDGVVVVRLVESKVGDLKVEGLQYLDPQFVEERINLKNGQIMSVAILEDDLIRFNRLNDTQLRASVKPGEQFGTTDIMLEAVEPPRFQNTLFVDNAGRETVGKNRVGVIARLNGMTSNGDSLVFSATGADGSKSYYLGYTLPLKPQDLSFNLNVSKGSIKVVEGPFAPLDITGSSQEISAGLTMPLAVSKTGMQNAYLRLANKQSVSEFGGFTQQDVTLGVLTLGMSWLHQGDNDAWSLDANFNQGDHWFGSDSRFRAIRTNGSWLHRLTDRDQLLIRGALQYSADDLLPTAEQFQLGGSNSVRGYSEGLLSGRQGYLMSLEYRHDVDLAAFKVSYPNAPSLTYLAFLEHGGAFPYRPSGQKQVVADDYLTGYGIGVQLNWDKLATLRLAVAKPIKHNANELDSRDLHLHAAISINWP